VQDPLDPLSHSRSTMRWLLAISAVALLVRLIAIDQPFVDVWSWRQSLLAMISENFYRQGFNIFYPQVSMAGQAPGYTGMEFPLVAYLAALLYPVLGVHDWIGRLISVAFFLAAIPCFYSLVRRIANERSALFAVALFSLAPLSVFASRAFMPDMASLALSILAVFLFARWLDHPERGRVLVAATAVTALAFLVKLTAMIVGVPLLYLGWRRYGLRLLRRPELWGFALGATVPSVVWWLHEHWVSTHHFPYELWGFQHGLKSVVFERWLDRLVSTFTAGVTPVVSMAMAWGFFLRRRGEFRHLFHWWLAGVFLFWILSGRAFAMHTWYGLPVVPPAAALAGELCDRGMAVLERRSVARAFRLSLAAAGFALFALLAFHYVRPHYYPWAIPYREAGLELRSLEAGDALVVFAMAGDPTGPYYSGLRACNFYVTRDARTDIRVIEGLRREGVRYVVFTEDQFWWLTDRPELTAYLDSVYRRVADRPRYVIYDVDPAQATRPRASAAGTDVLVAAAGEQCGCTEFGYECVPVEGTRIRKDLRRPPLAIPPR
jgi:4-amino-4-deoxy-L-arabinose transferase-like glycosyltransferase